MSKSASENKLADDGLAVMNMSRSARVVDSIKRLRSLPHADAPQQADQLRDTLEWLADADSCELAQLVSQVLSAEPSTCLDVATTQHVLQLVARQPAWRVGESSELQQIPQQIVAAYTHRSGNLDRSPLLAVLAARGTADALSAWAELIATDLFQGRLQSEVRLDEAKRPFLWISPMKPAARGDVANP